MKCFYHSADLDGICSGAIVKYAFPDCEMCPIDYGEEFPFDDLEYDELVSMVDFSLQPFDLMIELNKKCDLVWIDHHKSAIEDLKNSNVSFSGIQRIGEGACSLTWEYFYDDKVPLGIRLLSSYDVWDHSDPRTVPFQYRMRLAPSDPADEFWSAFFEELNIQNIDDFVEEGQLILDYQTKNNESFIQKCAFRTKLQGHNIIVANKLHANSQLFDSVYDPEIDEIMVTFGWKNGRWTVSLYSDKVDCGAIAKSLGGGGHAGAAGFQCHQLPFELK